MAANSPTRAKHVSDIFQWLLVCSFLLFGQDARANDVDRLYEAAGKGDVAAARQMITAGANINSKTSDGSQALNAAAVYNRHEMIRLLLAHGANPNVRNKEGDTPLICATKYAGGDPTTVKLLVDAGTDLSVADNDGKTALDYARKQSQEPAVALLKEAR